MNDGSMFNRSIENGTMAITRLSTAAVVQVVQPRFEPPHTTNRSTSTLPPSGLAQNDVIVSSARTALLVIGSRAGQRWSPVRKNLSQVYAISASSVRPCFSPANTSVWLGTIFNSVTTEWVALAMLAMIASPLVGGSLSLPPPVMYISPIGVF